MKKITDKMRLDWLQNHCGNFSADFGSDRWVMNGKIYRKIRRLIDAAMNAQGKGSVK